MNSADWWAKQLGTQVPQAQPRQETIPMPPSQKPMTSTPPSTPQMPSKARSTMQIQSCPDCGSSNYMSPQPNIALRCYDCGYPIQQSGSKFGSLTGAQVQGQTQAARGNDTTNNYNPQHIIGRVD